MKVRRLTTATLSIALGLFFLSGCAKWVTTDKMISRIEKKAPVGISEKEFKGKVPNAQLVGEEGNKKVYVLAVGEPCFLCGSGKAFLKSYESYATKFTFEDGKLVSTDRIVSSECFDSQIRDQALHLIQFLSVSAPTQISPRPKTKSTYKSLFSVQ